MPTIKGITLWEVDSTLERDAIGTDIGLRVGDICSVKGGELFRCSVAGATSSTWVQLGTGASSPTVQTFADNTTLDIPIGDVSTGTSVVGSLGLWNATTKEAATYRVTISMDDVGHADDINIIHSPTPVINVLVSTVLAGTTVSVRLTGSGAGDTMKATWQAAQSFSK